MNFDEKIVAVNLDDKQVVFAHTDNIPMERVNQVSQMLLKKFQNSTFFEGKYGVNKFSFEFEKKFRLYMQVSRNEHKVLKSDLMTDYIGYRDVTGNPVFIKIAIENK